MTLLSQLRILEIAYGVRRLVFALVGLCPLVRLGTFAMLDRMPLHYDWLVEFLEEEFLCLGLAH
jgi:hypothetical protein